MDLVDLLFVIVSIFASHSVYQHLCQQAPHYSPKFNSPTISPIATLFTWPNQHAAAQLVVLQVPMRQLLERNFRPQRHIFVGIVEIANVKDDILFFKKVSTSRAVAFAVDANLSVAYTSSE
jgi:hypothetical protein